MYVVLFYKSVILFNTGYGVSAWIFRFLLWLCIFFNSETPLSIVWWIPGVRRNICDTDTLHLPSDFKQEKTDNVTPVLKNEDYSEIYKALTQH